MTIEEVEERYRNGEPLIVRNIQKYTWYYVNMAYNEFPEFKFDWDRNDYTIITEDEINKFTPLFPEEASVTGTISLNGAKDKINNIVPEGAPVINVDIGVRSHNVGNSDYAKMKLQPWDVWTAWHLNPWDADIVKRIARTKEEPGMTPMEARRMDYEKIIHDAQECIRQIDAGTYWR